MVVIPYASTSCMMHQRRPSPAASLVSLRRLRYLSPSPKRLEEPLLLRTAAEILQTSSSDERMLTTSFQVLGHVIRLLIVRKWSATAPLTGSMRHILVFGITLRCYGASFGHHRLTYMQLARKLVTRISCRVWWSRAYYAWLIGEQSRSHVWI
jgi:hypothetical protein